MTAMHPDNHGTPISDDPAERDAQSRRSRITPSASSLPRAVKINMPFVEHRQPPDEKITDTIPLGPW